MMDRFARKCGTYICSEIIGFDISTDERKQYARELHAFAKCTEIVEKAVDVLEDIIKETRRYWDLRWYVNGL